MIEVIKYQERTSGSLRGNFSVHVPAWKISINGLAYHVMSDGTEFVTAPGKAWEDVHGDSHRISCITFDDQERRKEFMSACLAGVKSFLKARG